MMSAFNEGKAMAEAQRAQDGSAPAADTQLALLEPEAKRPRTGDWDGGKGGNDVGDGGKGNGDGGQGNMMMQGMAMVMNMMPGSMGGKGDGMMAGKGDGQGDGKGK